MFERVQDRVVLGAATDHVSAARRSTSCQAKHSEIARLGSAAGENQFMRRGAQKCGQLVARIIDCRARLAPGCVNARRISKMSIQVRQHCRARLIAHWRGRVVIKINHPMNAPLGSAVLCGRLGMMRSCFSS